MRRGPLRDRRPRPGSRLLPRPPARDHVHQAGAAARSTGADPEITLSLQGDPSGGFFPGGRSDLGLRVSWGRQDQLYAAWTRPEGWPPCQTGPLQRLAAQGSGTSPGLRFRTPAWTCRKMSAALDVQIRLPAGVLLATPVSEPETQRPACEGLRP